MLLGELHSEPDQIAKIDGVRLFKGRFVDLVDGSYLPELFSCLTLIAGGRSCVSSFCGVVVLLRRDQPLPATGDDAHNGHQLIGWVVEVLVVIEGQLMKLAHKQRERT